MNAVLECVRRSVRSDDQALSVLLSLLNVRAVAPGVLGPDGSFRAVPPADDAPPPADVELPGVLYLREWHRAGARPEQRLETLGTYLDLVEDDPGYSMRSFLDDLFGQEAAQAAEEPSPPPNPGGGPEPQAARPTPTPPWEPEPEAAPPSHAASDGGALQATLVVNEDEFLAVFEAVEKAGTQTVPWWHEHRLLESDYVFNLVLELDHDGPYIDAFLSDPDRRRIFADWPRRTTVFGEYTAAVAGRTIRIVVEPTDVPSASPYIAELAAR